MAMTGWANWQCQVAIFFQFDMDSQKWTYLN